MPDTLTLLMLLIPSLIVAVVLHEIGHGYAAKLLGDDTASKRGRLTLNPISHVDPLGTLVVPGLLALMGGPIFGWAKPVPVMKNRLRNPRFGMMAVAMAGPGTNFLLAALGSFALGLASLWSGVPLVENDSLVAIGLVYFVLINVIIGLFNMMPIPPFDGSHLVAGVLPQKLEPYWRKLQFVGLFLILGLVALSWFIGTAWVDQTILPFVQSVTEDFLSLGEWVAPA